ncbi:MAG: hypothetical protein QNJ70_16880 [Xenococcaceae cyanobacterium MO_207.B15]|nr:hypothetical protein [Xenococcaceae cyanobacterium MO_207.B15]
MSPRKLTEDDKDNILQLYRNSEATTSTLAKDFGVSSSTISRFLKNSLSQVEYEDLIQQKRLARTSKSSPTREEEQPSATASDQTTSESAPKIVSLPQKSEPTLETKLPEETSQPDTKQETVLYLTSSTESETETTEAKDLSEVSNSNKSEKSVIPKTQPIVAVKTLEQNLEEEDDEEEDDDDLDVITLEEILGEELSDDEDDEDDEDEDEDEDDGWESETGASITYPHTKPSKTVLQILPLARASFPRTCYVVIDRAAELITRPLEDFADLGSIPQEEVQQKTLPIFDNHRVAKRFSHRREKVIKVPDGRMLQKTSRHLHSKGITRLLIDGQIYAVSAENQ